MLDDAIYAKVASKSSSLSMHQVSTQPPRGEPLWNSSQAIPAIDPMQQWLREHLLRGDKKLKRGWPFADGKVVVEPRTVAVARQSTTLFVNILL